MNLINEFKPIREWATEKGIYKKGDLKTQCLKLSEEAGELAKAIINEDLEEIIDAIGDCAIVLTSIAELADKHFEAEDKLKNNVHKITIEHCINEAYKVINNRKGKMLNGSFCKDESNS